MNKIKDITQPVKHRAARSRAAILDIAREAADSGMTAVFWGYCLAAGIDPGRGGWLKLPGATRPVAHGRRAFAEMIAQADELGTYGIVKVLNDMAKHYEHNMTGGQA